jgi:rubrerythrin
MLKELEEWHKEELADEEKYMEMSKKAPKEYQGIFRDISREEGSHARILEAIINDYKDVYDCDETIESNNDTAADEIKHTENEKIILNV